MIDRIPPIYLFEVIFGIPLITLLVYSLQNLPRIKETKKERIPFFDVIKGLAIISIIGIHATDLFNGLSFLKQFFWFGLAFFTISSGYLLSMRNKDAVDMRPYFKNIFFRIIVVYIFFVMLFSMIQIGNFDLRQIIGDVFLGRTNGNYYYVPIILCLYLIFPVLIKYKKYIVSKLGLSVIFLFSFFFQTYDNYLQQPNWNSNPISLVFFGRYLFFFCIGILIAQIDRRYISFRKLWLLFVLFVMSIVTYALLFRIFYLPYIYPAILFIVLLSLDKYLVKEYGNFIFRFIGSLGRHSFIIYLVHIRVMYDVLVPIYSNMVSNSGIFTEVLFLILIVLCTVLSYLIAVGFMKLYSYLLKNSV